MKKKLNIIILVMCMVVSLLPATLITANATTGIETWDGTIAVNVDCVNGTYSIKNGAELAWIVTQVNSGENDFSGNTIKLTADIVLNDTNGWESWNHSTTGLNTWTTIGNSSFAFKGIFEGNDHTVSGIYISKEGTATSNGNQGLFGWLEGSTIKNVSVINSFIKGSSEVGAITGHATDSTIDNCSNASTVTGNNTVGGIVGQSDGTTIIRNCNNTGTVSANQRGAGIVAYSTATSTIDNCFNNGTIEAINSYPDTHAGIVAYNDGISVKNCYNNGDILGRATVGGIAGNNQTSTIENCYNTGAVNGSTCDLGGIVGNNQSPTSIVRNCYNTGSITESNDGWGSTGGIAGNNSSATIINCYNVGPITESNDGWDKTGGIVGVNNEGSISNTYYCGYDVGIGGEDAPQDGATPFAKIKDNPLGIGETTSIIEQTTTGINTAWANAFGDGFEVNYSNTYSSSNKAVATISGKNITGVSVGASFISGILTITQNELTSTGWSTENTKQIIVPLLIPLSVQQGISKLTITNIPESITYGDDNFTLSTTGGLGTGEVTYFSSDPTVFTVGENTGEVTIVGAGSATITETKAGDDKYKSVTASILIVINKANQSRIDSIAYSAESVDGKNDGALFWVDNTMEYRPKGGEYIGISGTQVDNLSPGTYEVRYKEKPNYNPSDALTLTIRQGKPQTYTITTSDITFDDKECGYEDINTKPLEITSKGNWETTIKEVSISGDAFELNKTSGTTIASGATDNSTYTVKPKSNLDVGSYEETVTIVYNNDEHITSKVRFHVNKKGSTGGGSYTPPVEPDTGADIIVNGKTQSAGDAKTETQNGKTTTTVTVDTDKLNNILESEGKGASVIIPVKSDSNVVKGALNGQMVKNMEKKEATLEIETKSATYTLPASEIDIDQVSKQYGEAVTLSDINVEITIAEPSDETMTVVEDAAKGGDFSIMVPAVDFTINCTYNGQTTNVSSFNSYVERMVAIPEGVDPTKITTGIVVHEDGTTHHVPTEVTIIDGKYYAKINSLTNSTYTVVWHPIEFTDVISHWAKDSINNMGSRMVINGVGGNNYDPDRSITRAEVAAIIVRAMGLDEGLGEETFTDVNESDWYCGYVKTAVSYGLIKGYGDGTFGPNDNITREQAAAMIARAMKKTGLEIELSESEITELLSKYEDSTNVSDYAKESIATCIKTEILKGRANGSLAPKDNISRAEVAVMIERLLQKSELI